MLDLISHTNTFNEGYSMSNMYKFHLKKNLLTLRINKIGIKKMYNFSAKNLKRGIGTKFSRGWGDGGAGSR